MLTAAVRGIEPIIMSFGAAFAALGFNTMRMQDVDHSEKKSFLKWLSHFRDEGEEDYWLPDEEDIPYLT